MLRQFFRLVVRTFFREVAVKGIEDLPEKGPVIFTPNHPNALIDPLLVFFLPPLFRVRFVAKAPLFDIPVLGRLMRGIGAIPVVRRFEADGRVDYDTFFAACLEAIEAGDSIVIFPEGVSRPQPRRAELKTGAARLALMALARDIGVRVVPLGLNYEHGAIFRTTAMVWVAPPVDTSPAARQYRESPQEAVRLLTGDIGRALDARVFQTDTARDRELMLRLERIYSGDSGNGNWPERLVLLKRFEAGLKALGESRAPDIDHLRQWVSQYDRWSRFLDRSGCSAREPASPSLARFAAALTGLPVAALGVGVNLLPYRLCDVIVKRIKKYDAAAAATYKVVWSLALFPAAWLVEALLVGLWLGWAAAAGFALLVVPLSWFTLVFLEWLQNGGPVIPVSWTRLRHALADGLVTHLADLRLRIRNQVDDLAADLETAPGPETGPPVRRERNEDDIIHGG